MENNLKYRIKRREEMKTVDVIFVSDELVGSMIVSRKEYERLMRQKVKSESDKLNSTKADDLPEVKAAKRKGVKENDINAKRSKIIDDVELALAALENDDVEKISYNVPSTLLDDGDVSAKEVVGMENNARRPKSRHKHNSLAEEDLKSPKSPTTPNKKKKVIRDIEEIQKILENSDGDFSGSDSDDDYTVTDESHSDSDTSDAILNCGLRSKKSDPSDTPRKLKTSKFTTEKLNELLKNFQISSEHKNSVEVLLKQTLSLFGKWDFLLRQNYNIILYGTGSKREILGKFVERFLDVHPVIVVNGFFPNVSVNDILEKVCTVLSVEPHQPDVIDRIKASLENHELTLYLAVNNIDGAMLRSDKVQTILSQLAKLDQVHVIASIDHAYAPLIWNKNTYGDFNWVWYDITNFLSYAEETAYEGNLLLQSTGKATLSSLRSVFDSLTKNGRGAFMVILRHQVQSGDRGGISFGDLYQQCRKDLLINSDVGLRAQLKEFIDHAILKEKRGADGEELFVISIENSILNQFLEEKERNEN